MVHHKMRDLVEWSIDRLMDHDQVPIMLECDDGEVEVIIEEVILSWYLWEFHRVYPKTPCLTRHVMKDLVITPKVHMDYLAVVQKDAYIASREDPYEELLPYNKVAFRIYNNLYNFMVSKLTKHMTSISILDYLDVMDHPKVKAANDRVKNAKRVTSKDIFKTYAEITEVLKSDESLKDNPLSVAFNHKLVSIDQILQDIGPRGFVSDIDSHIFKHPIRVGYAEGMSDLADYIAESRTGTTAEIMTGDPMRDSEYLNRLLQMSVSRVKHIYKGDCGSTKTFPWVIDTLGKLQDMDGIYYLNEETGEQEPIVPSKHKHLVGKEIQVRLVYGCQHPDRETVCAKCFGDLARNIHSTDIVGHISAIEHQSPQSQTVLSFKHLTGSASEFGIFIDDVAEQLFDVHNSDYVTYVKEWVSLDGYKFRLPIDSLRGFESLTRIESWDQVSPSRVTEIVSILMTDKEGVETEMMVADPENPVYFSMEALKFLTKAPVVVMDNGDYEFDMTGWDVKNPMFRIPKVQFDVVEYTKSLETFIKGPESSERKAKQRTIVDFTDPLPALVELHDMVAVRLHVNLSHLQCVILSSMVQDPENNDYRLPLDRSKGVFVSHVAIMRNGSAVSALGYQRQQDEIFNPEKYLDKPRPSHIYDPLLLGISGD